VRHGVIFAPATPVRTTDAAAAHLEGLIRKLQVAEVQARWFERRGEREAQSLTERLSEKGSIKFIHSSPGS